jgi:hypothetical protein
MSGQTPAARGFDEAGRQGLPPLIADAVAVRAIARVIAAAIQRNEPAAHARRPKCAGASSHRTIR